MNKTLKFTALLVILFTLLLTLTGCGDKIVATKEEDGMIQTMEIKFKGEEITEVVATMEVEDEEEATEFMAFMGEGNEEQLAKEGIESIEQDGNKIIMKLTLEEFKDNYGDKAFDEEAKEELIEILEKQGFTVK